MKPLRVSYNHLKMFEGGIFDIDLYAQDKVFPDDASVALRGKPIYTNNIVAIAGINASGKTVALSLLSLAFCIAEGRGIYREGIRRDISGCFDGGTCVDMLLWHGGEVYVLRSQIRTLDGVFGRATLQDTSIFVEEVLYRIPSATLTKTMLGMGFDELSTLGDEVMRRSSLDADQARFLQEDVSIVSAYANNRDRHLFYEAADFPLVLQEGFEGLDAVLRTFDSSIEHLEVLDGGRAYSLKFSNEPTPLALSRDGLEDVLSSGTIKGLVMVQRAIVVLQSGGYLLLDEIENHLNRQLVNVLIDLFADVGTNPYGATLVFTTHYPEVLDHVHRKDNVYFLTRGSNGRSKVVKYSSKVKRTENKKSEVFLSNFIEGTAPRYTDVAALRAYAAAAVRDADGE